MMNTVPDMTLANEGINVAPELQDIRRVEHAGEINAVVVPPATQFGVPVGVDIHDLSDIEIVVDPHIQGAAERKYKVRELDLRTQLAEQPTSGTANMDTAPARPVQPRVADTDIESEISYEPEYIPKEAAEGRRSVRSLKDRVKVTGSINSTGMQVGSSKPTRKVEFDVPGFGVLETFYHDIIVESQFVVLVYDISYTDGNKFFPRPSSPADDTASIDMYIVDADMGYKLSMIGVQFQHGSLEYAIMPIINEFTLGD